MAIAQIGFRLATEDDIEMVLALRRDLYERDGPFDQQPARAALEELITNPGFGELWLITYDLAPIGYLALTLGFGLEFDGRDAFIDELFVRADHRGRGVGSRALRFAETRCRERGAHALHLEVERWNTAAQGLYAKSGFRDHDRYLMTKRLK